MCLYTIQNSLKRFIADTEACILWMRWMYRIRLTLRVIRFSERLMVFTSLTTFKFPVKNYNAAEL